MDYKTTETKGEERHQKFENLVLTPKELELLGAFRQIDQSAYSDIIKAVREWRGQAKQ